MDDLSAKVDELGRRMENGFNRVDADIRSLRDDTKTEFGAVRKEMREGFEKVDARFDKIDERFEKVDERFEKVDERFEKVDERFDKVNERFDRMNERFDRFYGVLVRTCIGAVGLLAVLVTVIGVQA